MTINLKAFMKQVARAWGYPWTWLFFFALCSCEVQEQNFIEAVELQGSQWILCADQVPNLGDRTVFLPRDVLTVDADSIYLYNDLVTNQTTTSSGHRKSYPRTAHALINEDTTFRFRYVTPKTLAIERWYNNLPLDTTLFNKLADTTDNLIAKLEPLIGRTYRYPTAEGDRRLHLEWKGVVPGEADKKGNYYLIMTATQGQLKQSTSSKIDSIHFLDRYMPDFMLLSGNKPVLAYYTMRPSFKIHRYRLEKITSNSLLFARLETTPTNHKVVYVTAQREFYTPANDWTAQEIQALLNEGEIVIDNDTDFQPTTEIEYSDEASLAEDGISPADLKYFDFTFSEDGFYSFFVRDRQIASGRYRISADQQYLLMGTDEGMNRSIRLFSDTKDQLNFSFPVKMRTPKPLGEVLTSWYWLELVVGVKNK